MFSKAFDFSEVLGFGWRTMKENLAFFVGMGIILFLISSFGQLFGYVIQQFPENILLFLALLLFPVMLIIEIILAIGLIKISLSFCDGQKPKLSMLFDAWGCFWSYVGAAFLYCLIIMVPPAACFLLPLASSADIGIAHFTPFLSILAFILAVALSIKYSLCFYFVVDKGLGPINALKASSLTTMDAKGSLFLFGILCCLINLLGVLCFGIGIFATLPTVMVAMALAYRQLSAQTPMLGKIRTIDPAVQPGPVIHSGLSIRHTPTIPTDPAINRRSGLQHVLGIHTGPGTQHVSGNQPDSRIQHASGIQPDTRIQHASGNQPDTGIQSVSRDQPVPRVQSVSRARPVSEKKESNFLFIVAILGIVVVIVAGFTYYLTKPEPVNKDVVLTGILYAGDNSSAVVDGKIVHEKETINGVKIIKIHEDKVEFEMADKRWTQYVK